MFTFLLFPELLQQFSEQKFFVFNVFPAWAIEDYFFNLGWTSWSLETLGEGIFLLYKLFITVVVHWAVLQFSVVGFTSDAKSTFLKILYSVGLLIIGLAVIEYLMWFFLVMAIILSWILNSLGYLLGFLGFVFIVLPMIAICFVLLPMGLFLLYENYRSKNL